MLFTRNVASYTYTQQILLEIWNCISRKMDLGSKWNWHCLVFKYQGRICQCWCSALFLFKPAIICFNYAFPLPYVRSGSCFDLWNILIDWLISLWSSESYENGVFELYNKHTYWATVFRVWQIFTSAVNTTSMFWVLKWNYNGFSMGRKMESAKM